MNDRGVVVVFFGGGGVNPVFPASVVVLLLTSFFTPGLQVLQRKGHGDSRQGASFTGCRVGVGAGCYPGS